VGLLASATAHSVSQERIASRLRERVGLRVRSCVQSRVWHEAAATGRPIVGSTLVYAQPQCRVFCPKFKTLGGHRRADPATRMGEGGRAGARAQGAANAGARLQQAMAQGAGAGQGKPAAGAGAGQGKPAAANAEAAFGSVGSKPGRRRRRGRRRRLTFAASAHCARHACTQPTLAAAPASCGSPPLLQRPHSRGIPW
jgi:hypothetical protein